MGAITVGEAAGGAGAGVIRGSIVMPRSGCWHADLHLERDTNLAGPVFIQVGTSLTLRGTINRSAVHRGIVQCRIVAGADGLRKPARPKHYTSPVLRLVLADLARDAGEAISATAQVGVLAHPLLSWTTLALSTGSMVHALMALAPDGTVWRFLPDGTVWAGLETWPDSGIRDARELGETPEEGHVRVGLDLPTLLPGTKLGDRKVDRVEYSIAPSKVVTDVWTSP